MVSIWEAYCKTSWPSDIGPHEGELMTLDSVITGCVRDFLSDKNLHSKRVKILESCVSELEILLPELEGVTNDYFNRLGELARILLIKHH